MTKERYTLPMDENGNVEFTKEFLQQTGWQPGTKLEWRDNEDGTVSIFELEDTEDGN